MAPSDAMAALYRRVAPKVAVVLRARLRVPLALAEDVIQDVFETLLRSPQSSQAVLSLDEAGAFRYLLTASYRRAVHEIQRRARAEAPAELALARALGAPTPEEDLDLSALLDTLRSAYAGLPGRYREVLDLVIFQQKTPSQAAERLGRTRSTVYQQIHRGLAMLRHRIDERRRPPSPRPP
jgi:RNA polymerase sigma-70 factor (ECF subfamily)